MNNKIKILLIPFIIIFGTIAAQEEQSGEKLKSYQKLEVGYMFGGQAYNDNFSYNPGFQGHGVFGFHITKRFNVGFGIGYYQLTKERFLPVFAEVNGYTKGNDKISNLITMQLGYAPGWYNEPIGYSDYNYSGGIMFDAGFALQIKINNTVSAYFKLSYRHQFAHISYELFRGTTHSESLNYDLLNIAFGIKYSK
ncbi:MAG: hypothetical protein PHE33_02800 [Bacteroidales bacterium]|nr:hypothetical protein [Bacteroidales bacterium]